MAMNAWDAFGDDAGTREEALSDIDSEEEREFEEFSNDWRGLRTRPS